jgi:uncharacterized membrane protein
MYSFALMMVMMMIMILTMMVFFYTVRRGAAVQLGDEEIGRYSSYASYVFYVCGAFHKYKHVI